MGRTVTSEYFSGQGIVYLSEKNGTTGALLGYTDVGNVSELTLTFSTEVVEHKESRSGNRLTDMRLTTGKTCTSSITLDSFDANTLKTSMFATVTTSTSGNDVTESVVAKVGKVVPLSKIKVSDLVLKNHAETITYELDKNYTYDANAGSIYFFTTAEQTAASAANSIADDADIHCIYDHAAQESISAFKAAQTTYSLRFEGLNTANNNEPVIVTIPNFRPDPLKDLNLIKNELQSFVLEGAALADTSTGDFVIIQKL